MKQTGELLKSARENKKLTLHEIGMSLKINPKTLQAMEDGETEKLPQRTFLRGFVKSYAQFLKLDVKHTMATFDYELNGGTPPILLTPAPLPSQKTIEEKAMPISTTPELTIATAAPTEATVTSETTPTPIVVATPIIPIRSAPKLSERAPNHLDRSQEARTQRLLLFIGGLLLVAIIVIVAKLVNKYQKERSNNFSKIEVARLQDTTTPATATEMTAPTSAPTLVEESLTPPPITPVNSIDVKAPPQTPTSPLIEKMTTLLPSDKKDSTNQKTVTAPTVVETEASKTTKAAEKSVEKTETETNTLPIGKPQEVIVETLAKVTISYQLDDGKLQRIELNADEMHTFKGKNIIKLDVSDGGAVNLIVNGREKGSPGRAGTPVKLSYPK